MFNAQVRWLHSLTEKLQQAQMRACVVLIGETAWHQAIYQHYALQNPAKKGIWVGQDPPIKQASPLTSQNAAHRLGQETDFAIFSAQEGIDPNTLGIVSGMIRAGGLCFIGLPEEQSWLKMPNIACQKYLSFPYQLTDTLKGFNAFLWQQLSQHALVLKQHESPEHLVKWLNQPSLNPSQTLQSLPTLDQLEAIARIQKVALGHRKRPLLLTADRGRGKSTALGLAAVALIKSGKHHIIITAARQDQAQTALQVIEQVGLHHSVVFKAPDDLIQHPCPTDLLLVDEAAHLPLPMLLNLLQHYPRVVLASTQQGYEGTGRGFELKLRALLDQHFPNWQSHEMHTPIRWRAGDWLENTLNQTLLLTHVSSNNPPTGDEMVYQVVQVGTLLQTPQRLTEIFQLLVGAHYQTTPNDLMQLLEMPNLQLLVASQNERVVGVVLAVMEGALPLHDVDKPRRVQGHLFAQKLYQQTGNPDWLRLKGLRVMRIAVADAWQNQQIGSNLLKRLKRLAEDLHLDYLATSFGVTQPLLGFWTKNHYQTMGLGFKKDQASGSYSIYLCQPLNAVTLVHHTRQLFAPQWVYSLPNHYADLETPILLTILKTLAFDKVSFPLGYLQQQPYESLSLQLRNWTLGHLDFLIEQNDPALQHDFTQKLLLNQDWTKLLRPAYNSRKQLESLLKSSLSHYLSVKH